MRVAIGSDHAAVSLKGEIAAVLVELGVGHHDFGCFGVTAVDYPDIARDVAEAVARGQFDRGIILCGTGIGVCIAANKVSGIRAALCHDPYSAQMSRQHNDANVLCLGARIIGPGLAAEIVRVWLSTEFSGAERHARRVSKIGEMDGRP